MTVIFFSVQFSLNDITLISPLLTNRKFRTKFSDQRGWNDNHKRCRYGQCDSELFLSSKYNPAPPDYLSWTQPAPTNYPPPRLLSPPKNYHKPSTHLNYHYRKNENSITGITGTERFFNR